jgi:hypothetical protein
VSLVVAPCSHEAAKYAVLNWHYSKRMPRNKMVKFGVWENKVFVGSVIYGSSANAFAFAPYGLDQTEGCELLRVAMRKHSSFVTQVIAKSMRQLKQSQASLRLVISFADPEQGHEGKIYQAGNWTYAGMTGSADEYIVNGVRMHGRALRSTRSTHRLRDLPASNVEEWAKKALDPNIVKASGSSKHRYLYPLDRAMRRQVQRLALPYPSADEGSTVSRDTPGVEVQVRPLPSAPERPTDA